MTELIAVFASSSNLCCCLLWTIFTTLLKWYIHIYMVVAIFTTRVGGSWLWRVLAEARLLMSILCCFDLCRASQTAHTARIAGQRLLGPVSRKHNCAFDCWACWRTCVICLWDTRGCRRVNSVETVGLEPPFNTSSPSALKQGCPAAPVRRTNIHCLHWSRTFSYDAWL